MSDYERAVVMAYTGVTMLVGDKMQLFYKYLKNIMGRPVFTHELADESIQKEIRAKSKNDFIALCAGDDGGRKIEKKDVNQK